MMCRYSLREIKASSCYVNGCRSASCRAAIARQQRQLRAARSQGEAAGLVPAGPARKRLEELYAAGMTMRAIERATGLSRWTMTSVRKGHGLTVQTATADAIAAVRLKPAAMGLCDATGTRRRLQALAALGWSLRALSAESGLSHQVICAIQHGKPRVQSATVATVEALYNRLWDTHPSRLTQRERQVSTLARRSAERNGWLPPLAWDDDSIADPNARPQTGRTRDDRKVIVDEVAVERLKRGQAVPVNKAEQRTAIAELAASGVRSKEIADRLGMGLSSAIRTRNRITAAERQTA